MIQAPNHLVGVSAVFRLQTRISDGTSNILTPGLSFDPFESQHSFLYTLLSLIVKRTGHANNPTLNSLHRCFLFTHPRFRSYVKHRKHIVVSREGFGYFCHFNHCNTDCAIERHISNYQTREAG